MSHEGTRVRAVTYARFSSDKQRVESIADQERVCRAYAEAHGMEVVGSYADEAMSGTSDHRPAFLRMMGDARGRGFSVVLVYKLDRFSRDRYDSAVWKHRLRGLGVRVVSATEWVPETPEGALMESMLEGYAEFYSRQLAQNVRRGMEGNARRCLTNGVRVFGYRTAADGTYEVDPAQAEIVREVFSRYLGGEALASVLRDMRARGVRSAQGNPVSRTWVDTLIHNRRYLGEYSWGGVVVPGGMPRIVDDATFGAAQRRGRGRRSADLAQVHPFPLSGRLWDRETGLPWSGTSGTSATGRTYWYYELRLRGRTVRLPQDRVEAACAAAVREALSDLGRLRAAAEAASAASLDDAAVRAAESELADVRRRRENLLRAVEDGLPASDVGGRLGELAGRESELSSRLDAERSRGFDVASAMAALSRLDALAPDGEVCDRAVASATLDRDGGSVVVRLATEGPPGPGVRVTPPAGAPSAVLPNSPWWWEPSGGLVARHVLHA